MAPIYDGPFGLATDVVQTGGFGGLDAGDVDTAGGEIVGVADDGDNVVAVWRDGDLAPGAGRLVIATDVDSVFLSAFDPANDNGRWSLNTIAFLVTDPVVTAPEPAPFALFGLGLLSLGLLGRQKKVRTASITS